MQKIYSLLRNNKQTGPYTLEELVQLSLKPFDLIWVDGRSAGWSYPTEIAALKNYVAEAPNPLEKKEAVAFPQENLLEIANSSLEANSSSTPNRNTIERKPDSFVKSKRIYISLPAGTAVPSVFTQTSSSIESVEEETPEEKLERKALELRNKIQAFNENKNQSKADPGLDTKYARSLDDIKEEYSSWLYQQKKKRVLPKKTVQIISAVILLTAGGYFLIPKLLNAKPNQGQVSLSQNPPSPIPIQAEPSEGKKLPGKKMLSSKQTKKIKKMATISLPAIPKKTTTAKKDKVDAYIDSLLTVKKNKQQQPEEEKVYGRPAANQATRQKTMRDEDAAEPTKVTAAKEVNNTSITNITELIKLSESTGSGTPHLTLYNNSNQYIKFVAVDVSYYKANQKLLQKKTLYFNDIAPKSSAKLFVPQEKNAASIHYQMGLISTDGGLYYAKQ